MCSPCYNNSFYVASPASPWCGTAEPGQVISCLTECSSYGLAPQTRPRPYPGPCIFSWLLSVYPQLLHLAYHQRKNIHSLYSTENHQGCKKKGQVFLFSLSSMFTSGPPIFIYCSKMCVSVYMSISPHF